MLAKQDSLHDIYFGQRETLIIHFDTSVTQVWHKCDASERLASPDFNELESKVNLNRLRWRRLVRDLISSAQIKQTFSRDWNQWWLDVAVIFTLCLHPPNFPSDYYAVGAQPVA